jgi:hypothetical protein
LINILLYFQQQQKISFLSAVNFSVSSLFLEQNQIIKEPHKNIQIKTDEIPDWKKNVVVVPVQTTIEDLKKTHRLVKDGFYVSQRIYVEKMPEKYTIEPIKTKRTGGRDLETGILVIIGWMIILY